MKEFRLRLTSWSKFAKAINSLDTTDLFKASSHCKNYQVVTTAALLDLGVRDHAATETFYCDFISSSPKMHSSNPYIASFHMQAHALVESSQSTIDPIALYTTLIRWLIFAYPFNLLFKFCCIFLVSTSCNKCTFSETANPRFKLLYPSGLVLVLNLLHLIALLQLRYSLVLLVNLCFLSPLSHLMICLNEGLIIALTSRTVSWVRLQLFEWVLHVQDFWLSNVRVFLSYSGAWFHDF